MKIQLTIWWCWIIIYIALNSFMYAKELRVMKLVEGLHKPVYLTAPENNSDTLFIVEQHGVVQRLINGEVALSPLLNICHQVYQPKMLEMREVYLDLHSIRNFQKMEEYL